MRSRLHLSEHAQMQSHNRLLQICINNKIKITGYKDYTGITGQAYKITAMMCIRLF